jgi:hypothetical protein
MLAVLRAPVALQPQKLTPTTQARLLPQGLRQDGPHPGCFGGMETVSRFLPLARRRLSTIRPPGVAIRARNPCVRFLRRLLGWYVLFMAHRATGAIGTQTMPIPKSQCNSG